MNKQMNWVVLAIAASVAPGLASCELGAIGDRVADAAGDHQASRANHDSQANEAPQGNQEAVLAAAGTVQLAGPSASAAAEPSSATAEPSSATAEPSGNTLVFPEAATITNAHVAPGFVAWVWASGLSEPSAILVDETGNTLVVERDLGHVLALWDADENGVSAPDERAIIAEAPGINSLVLHAGYLFASSATTVFRWRYAPPPARLGEADVVITGLDSAGETALFVNDQGLYLATSERKRYLNYSQIREPAVRGTGGVRLW
jgi:hypothetical protein